MSESPDTRASLLARLRGPRDEAAWAEFLGIYEPLVRRLARSRGLQEADADDLVQDVFRAVAGAIDRWDPDPARGSFRAWLCRIARNLTINLLAARRPGAVGSGDTDVKRMLDRQPAPDGPDTALFDLEYRRRLFHWAIQQVRGQFGDATWRAFERTALGGERPAEVAADMGISPGAVYVYRNRVMARIRRKIEAIDPESFAEE
jgi:RNA polymerase sigma factor (sigma-70 family)